VRRVARGCEMIKGARVEFSSSTRKGEKFSAPQEVLVFRKNGRKGKWQSHEGSN